MKILFAILIIDAIVSLILSVANYFIKRSTNKIINDFVKETKEAEKNEVD